MKKNSLRKFQKAKTFAHLLWIIVNADDIFVINAAACRSLFLQNFNVGIKIEEKKSAKTSKKIGENDDEQDKKRQKIYYLLVEKKKS